MNLTNSLTINLTVGPSGKILFGDQSQLRGKKVRALVARTTPGEKTSDGVAVAANLSSAYVSLLSAKGETIHDNVPLVLLDPAKTAGVIHEFAPKEIDWTKCVVNYAGRVDADAGKQIPFLVIYE